MAHKLKIAGAEYPEVSKVTFTDTDGNQQSYLAEDEVFTTPQVQMLAELEDGTLRLVDTTAVDLASTVPAGNHDVWIEVEGEAEQTLPGAATISTEQPSDGIWIEPEE